MERHPELPLLAEARSPQAHQGLHLQRHQPRGLPQPRREAEARGDRPLCLSVSHLLVLAKINYTRKYISHPCVKVEDG